jgi:hypothetical protein
MFCLCSSRQQRIHVCYTCLTLFVLFPLTTRHCMERSSIQQKLKSLRSLLSKLRVLTVENGRGLCVFSTSDDHLVQDISLDDKGAAAFQVVNKMFHNLRHFWAVNQTGSFPRKTGFVRQCFTHTCTGHENLLRRKNKLYTSLKI